MLDHIAKAIIKNRFGMTQYPQFITFIPTWRCNGRCVFCDVWKKQEQGAEEMKPKEIEDIFTHLKRIDVLRITGGEPFLRKDLAEVINRINAVNPPTLLHITTNGFLTERIVHTIEAINLIENVHIKVSIDGVGEKHDQLRGVKGAYEKAMNSIQALVKIREHTPLHIGVNQAIVSGDEIETYFQLRDILQPYDIPIYPSIAFDPANALYGNYEGVVDPELSFRTFGTFSASELKAFMKILIKDGKRVSNLQEQIVDRYHLKGLYNRLVKNKNVPNPKCVALNTHLRILPNGDVPVCLYNGNIVGNLMKQDFRDIWFGDHIQSYREWVKKCSGCWQSCESAVNAIYTGDIWKGLFY